MSIGLLKEMPITVPPVPQQRRSASILRAYDDLIEVNRRRIAMLEEMARRLFDEWFVHFRFPGHDNPGCSSKEWRTLRLGDVADVNAASVRADALLGRIGYIDISSVSVATVENIEWMDFASSPGRARRRVRDGSIIWSTVRPNRRSYALLLEPDPDIIVSTGFAVLDARDAVPFSYMYFWVTTDKFVSYLTNSATGSAYPAVTGATFERAEMLVPPTPLSTKFAEIAEPMLRLSSKLKWACAKLAASRDLLLPRLISGELSVDAAERELEDAA